MHHTVEDHREKTHRAKWRRCMHAAASGLIAGEQADGRPTHGQVGVALEQLRDARQPLCRGQTSDKAKQGPVR